MFWSRKVLSGVLAAGLSVAATVGVVAPPSGSVSAQADDIVAIVVDGTGFGHGRGMSQWGAYGWAVEQGKSWEWILDHYFGGTTLGDVPVAGQRIKVRLTKVDGLNTVGMVSHAVGEGVGITWNGLTNASVYAVETSSGTFDVYGSPSVSCPGSATIVVPSGDPAVAQGSDEAQAVTQIQTFLKTFHNSSIGIDGDFGAQTKTILTSWQTAEALTDDGVWNPEDAARANEIIDASSQSVTWTLLGEASGTLRFTTDSGEDSGSLATTAIGLCNASGAVTHYRGAIDVSSQPDGNRVVNDVKVEDYLRGVVPKEIGASWATAGGGAGVNAVRAQAVAARSYGLQQNRYSYATTCDTTSCQVYGGAATRTSATGTPKLVEDFRTDQAIVATAGKIRVWPNGDIVSTEFSASNGPRTAGGAFPPVDDVPGDGVANNPNHRWTRVIDADKLEDDFSLDQLVSVTTATTQSSQYQGFDGIWFDDVVLSSADGTKRMQAWDFRGRYALPSPGFTVRVIREDTTGNSFGLIGDSVGNSIAAAGLSELNRLTDGTFTTATIDVHDGRCTTNVGCPGLSGVQVAELLPVGLDLVVVELGYNDRGETFARDIDLMMDALEARNVRQVAWINLAEVRMSSSGPIYRPMNDALAAAAAARSNLAVLDWNSASSGGEARDRWFTDGVHLTITGQAEFALWLREEMVELAPSHYLTPPNRIEVPVRGASLVGVDGAVLTIPDDAAAVALNLTAVAPSARGFATVWPCSTARPTSSNLNWESRRTVANSVIAPIGGDGKVCLYADTGTDAIVDVAGWFAGDGTVEAPTMVGVRPQRFVDTRDNLGHQGMVTPDNPLEIDLGGVDVTLADGGAAVVPSTLSALSINVTAAQPTGTGYLTVHPCDTARPTTSNVNYVSGRNVGSGVLAPVAADGSLCVFSSRPAHVLIDLLGWLPVAPADDAGGFAPVTPRRLVDTRNGVGGRSGAVSPGEPVVVQVRGIALSQRGSAVVVPDTASAAAVTVTAVRPSANGYVTIWPCGAERPVASNSNYRSGEIVANGAVAPIGIDGTVCVYTDSPAHILVDMFGWFPGGEGAVFTGSVPDRFVDTRFAVGPYPVGEAGG